MSEAMLYVLLGGAVIELVLLGIAFTAGVVVGRATPKPTTRPYFSPEIVKKGGS